MRLCDLDLLTSYLPSPFLQHMPLPISYLNRGKASRACRNGTDNKAGPQNSWRTFRRHFVIHQQSIRSATDTKTSWDEVRRIGGTTLLLLLFDPSFLARHGIKNDVARFAILIDSA